MSSFIGGAPLKQQIDFVVATEGAQAVPLLTKSIQEAVEAQDRARAAFSAGQINRQTEIKLYGEAAKAIRLYVAAVKEANRPNDEAAAALAKQKKEALAAIAEEAKARAALDKQKKEALAENAAALEKFKRDTLAGNAAEIEAAAALAKQKHDTIADNKAALEKQKQAALADRAAEITAAASLAKQKNDALDEAARVSLANQKKTALEVAAADAKAQQETNALLKESADAKKRIDADLARQKKQAQADEAQGVRDIDAMIRRSDADTARAQRVIDADKRKAAADEIRAIRELIQLRQHEFEIKVRAIVGDKSTTEEEKAAALKALSLATQIQIEEEIKLKNVTADTTSMQARSTRTIEGIADRQIHSVEQTRKAYYNLGTTMFFVAQAAQDAQYGFAAVVNNIGLVSLSLAGAMGKSQEAAMGWAAALQVGGVVIQQTLPYIKQFAKSLDLSDQFNAMTADVDRLKERLKELDGKWFKVNIDHQQIDETKRLLKDTEEALARLKAVEKTTAEDEAGANASKLVKDTMGDKLRKRFAEDTVFRMQTVDQYVQDAIANRSGRIPQMEKDVEDLKGGILGEARPALIEARGILKDNRERILELQGIADKQASLAAEKKVGRFLSGDATEVATMRGDAVRHPERYDLAFRTGLITEPLTIDEVKADRREKANIKRQEEDAKARKEEKTKAESAAAKLDSERKAQAATLLDGPERKESLYMMDLADQGKTADEIRKALAAHVAPEIKGLVDHEADIPAVADHMAAMIVRKNDEDLRKAGWGQDRKAAIATVRADIEARPDVSPVARKAQHEATAAAAAQRRKEADERREETEAERYAASVPGTELPLKIKVATQLREGRTPQQILAAEQAAQQKELEGRDIPAAEIPDAARHVIKRAIKKVEGMRRPGEDFGDVLGELEDQQADEVNRREDRDKRRRKRPGQAITAEDYAAGGEVSAEMGLAGRMLNGYSGREAAEEVGNAAYDQLVNKGGFGHEESVAAASHLVEKAMGQLQSLIQQTQASNLSLEQVMYRAYMSVAAESAQQIRQQQQMGAQMQRSMQRRGNFRNGP